MSVSASGSGAPVLGVFGGAFDPPHLGHAMVPGYLHMRGLVDRVLVVPCADHPLGKELSPLSRRMALTRAAMATHGELVELCDIEARLLAEQGGPSYTLRMLEAVQREHPGAVVRLVVGSDTLADVPRWHRWDEIERRFDPIVVPRSGHGDDACALPLVSSTQIRGWLRDGGPRAEEKLRASVPAAVLRMLRQPPGQRVWLVGHGHAATHAAPWLEAGGHQVERVGGRALVDGDRPDAAAPDAVWVLVHDPAIPAVAQALAALSLPPGVPVLHGAGAHRAADRLAALAERGHPVGTLHPICSLRRERPGAASIFAATFGIEGDPAARAVAQRWLGAQPWLDLQDLDEGGRRAYHAACALAANHLAVPHWAARGVLVGQGLPGAAVDGALATLVRSALDNLLALGVPAGVTGPVARGDRAAVQAHVAALDEDAAALYQALSARLAALVGAPST
ncbi:MAG: DUF2520 domain-containing protein [Myxococcales bacterium]|nr:DUF2520 domain-containing protein [Myxococcales bacterium]